MLGRKRIRRGFDPVADFAKTAAERELAEHVYRTGCGQMLPPHLYDQLESGVNSFVKRKDDEGKVSPS